LEPIHRSALWIVTGVIGALLFILLFGRGLTWVR